MQTTSHYPLDWVSGAGLIVICVGFIILVVVITRDFFHDSFAEWKYRNLWIKSSKFERGQLREHAVHNCLTVLSKRSENHPNLAAIAQYLMLDSKALEKINAWEAVRISRENKTKKNAA